MNETLLLCGDRILTRGFYSNRVCIVESGSFSQRPSTGSLGPDLSKPHHSMSSLLLFWRCICAARVCTANFAKKFWLPYSPGPASSVVPRV